MIYFIVLMDRDIPVAVYSYDNEAAQLEMIDVLSKRELSARCSPYYTHAVKINEVN